MRPFDDISMYVGYPSYAIFNISNENPSDIRRDESQETSTFLLKPVHPTEEKETTPSFFPNFSRLGRSFSPIFSQESLQTIKNTANVASGMLAIITVCYFFLATGNFILSPFQITGLETVPFVLKGALSFFLFGISTYIEQVVQKKIKKEVPITENPPLIKDPFLNSEEDSSLSNNSSPRGDYAFPAIPALWASSSNNPAPGVGLYNGASICYANSVFQLLRPFLSPLLFTEKKRIHPLEEDNVEDTPNLAAFFALEEDNLEDTPNLAAFFALEEKRIHPLEEEPDLFSLIHFYEQYENRALHGGSSVLYAKPSWLEHFTKQGRLGMQDSGEFCVFLLDQLSESLKRLGVDSDWFSFNLTSHLKLGPIDWPTIREKAEAHNVLELPFTKLEGAVSLEEMLADYSKEEEVEFPHSWDEQGNIIESKPTGFLGFFTATRKFSEYAKKSLTLGVCQQRPLLVRFKRALHIEEIGTVKSHAKITGAFSVSIGGVTKELQGFIVHRGSSIDYGHYVAYVKDPSEDGKWKCYSDSQVSYVEKEEVQEKSQDMAMAVYL